MTIVSSNSSLYFQVFWFNGIKSARFRKLLTYFFRYSVVRGDTFVEDFCEICELKTTANAIEVTSLSGIQQAIGTSSTRSLLVNSVHFSNYSLKICENGTVKMMRYLQLDKDTPLNTFADVIHGFKYSFLIVNMLY